MIATGEKENGQEADDRCADSSHHRRSDLGCGAADDIDTSLPASAVDETFGGPVFFPIRQVVIDVLKDDDPHVDHRSDRDGNSGKRHDVRVHAEDIHGDERNQHSQRQRNGNDQAGPKMQQEQDDDRDRDQRLLHQSFAERVDGFVNQKRAVVDACYFDTAEFRFERSDLCFDVLDDGAWILAITHHDDATNGFGTV